MEFNIKGREEKLDIPKREIEIATDFAKRIYKEFGTFIKGVVIFGSVARREKLAKEGDIDVLVLVDDVTLVMTKELTQTYRIITEKILVNMNDGKRLHIQGMKFSTFWEYVRAGDPVVINILRYGLPLIDSGFFEPLQSLLYRGGIRPSQESVYNYFVSAPSAVVRAKEHLLNAVVNLYWATIDSAHAVLMFKGHIPPSPDHVPDLLDSVFVKKRILSKRYPEILRRNYRLFKQIVHRDIKEIDGKDYDRYKRETIDFVNKMRKILEKKN